MRNWRNFSSSQKTGDRDREKEWNFLFLPPLLPLLFLQAKKERGREGEWGFHFAKLIPLPSLSFSVSFGGGSVGRSPPPHTPRLFGSLYGGLERKGGNCGLPFPFPFSFTILRFSLPRFIALLPPPFSPLLPPSSGGTFALPPYSRCSNLGIDWRERRSSPK